MQPSMLRPLPLLLPAPLLAAPLLLAPLQEEEDTAPPGPGVLSSQDCATCHSGSPDAVAMRDTGGRSIAPYDLWSSSMMANSARDPLWRAMVSAELAALPGAREEIESTCLRCHAPMADAVGLQDHGTGSLLHVLECGEPLGEVARDGASCTICHGLRPDTVGREEHFSGRLELDPWRRLYGPHEEPFEAPMLPFTGFTPTHGEHVLDAGLCSTCHTLETETLDAEGVHTGERFLEQSIYLEWQNSSFAARDGSRGVSCQQCHLPQLDEEGRVIETVIARNPAGLDFPATSPRQPYGRHLLVGGNTLLPAILRDHREELGVVASDAALDATLAAAREQLERRTASLRILQPEREGSRLRFQVEVTNRTGHKLPTGHPTRRAWLRVVIRDGKGEVVFASGQVDAAGRLVDGAGRVLPAERAGGPQLPHLDVVRAGEQVATYQGTPADSEGTPTYTLSRAARWLVDDRLLPQGWSSEHPEAGRTAPVGLGEDTDFRAGRDRVTYELELGQGTDRPSGSLTVEAELCYQTLSARWADELFQYDTPEVRAFQRMYEAAERGPVVLARARSAGL